MHAIAVLRKVCSYLPLVWGSGLSRWIVPQVVNTLILREKFPVWLDHTLAFFFSQHEISQGNSSFWGGGGGPIV